MKSLSSITKATLALIVLAAMATSAQMQQAWVAKYNNNGITNGNHQALKMALDSVGNIYVLGVSANANSNTGYVIVKYAPNGNQVWAARYDSTSYPTATPSGFALDNSKNVVVTGNAVTMRLGANGNLLWTVPYSAPAIAVDIEQNVYITGINSNFTTMKLNPAGSNLWMETAVFEGYPDNSQAIAVDSMTNIYVAGSETYYEYRSSVYVRVAVVKYDPNGNQMWEGYSGEGNSDADVRVIGFLVDRFADAYVEANFVGPDGPFQTYKFNSQGSVAWNGFDPTDNDANFASGLVMDSVGNVIVTGQNAYYPPLPSYGTYKLDTNGDGLWTNLYPMSSYGGSAALALTVDAVNNIYVTGESSITNTPYDIATIKLDSNGNQLWMQRYSSPGPGNAAGNAIAVDSSGNVYVAGYGTETNGFTSMILIKYSPITLQKQSNGSFILHAYGAPGETFDFQASTNLQTWIDLGDAIADTNGLVQFDDTNAPLFDHRFYYTAPH